MSVGLNPKDPYVNQEIDSAWKFLQESRQVQQMYKSVLLAEAQRGRVFSILFSHRLDGSACWVTEDKASRIIVNPWYYGDTTSLKHRIISAIVFELLNAQCEPQFERLRTLALAREVNREQYVRAIEKIEFHNNEECNHILDGMGIAPQNDAIDDFELFYKYEQLVGHSDHISSGYSLLTGDSSKSTPSYGSWKVRPPENRLDEFCHLLFLKDRFLKTVDKTGIIRELGGIIQEMLEDQDQDRLFLSLSEIFDWGLIRQALIQVLDVEKDFSLMQVELSSVNQLKTSLFREDVGKREAGTVKAYLKYYYQNYFSEDPHPEEFFLQCRKWMSWEDILIVF